MIKRKWFKTWVYNLPWQYDDDYGDVEQITGDEDACPLWSDNDDDDGDCDDIDR